MRGMPAARLRDFILLRGGTSNEMNPRYDHSPYPPALSTPCKACYFEMSGQRYLGIGLEEVTSV